MNPVYRVCFLHSRHYFLKHFCHSNILLLLFCSAKRHSFGKSCSIYQQPPLLSPFPLEASEKANSRLKWCPIEGGGKKARCISLFSTIERNLVLFFFSSASSSSFVLNSSGHISSLSLSYAGGQNSCSLFFLSSSFFFLSLVTFVRKYLFKFSQPMPIEHGEQVIGQAGGQAGRQTGRWAGRQAGKGRRPRQQQIASRAKLNEPNVFWQRFAKTAAFFELFLFSFAHVVCMSTCFPSQKYLPASKLIWKKNNCSRLFRTWC